MLDHLLRHVQQFFLPLAFSSVLGCNKKEAEKVLEGIPLQQASRMMCILPIGSGGGEGRWCSLLHGEGEGSKGNLSETSMTGVSWRLRIVGACNWLTRESLRPGLRLKLTWLECNLKGVTLRGAAFPLKEGKGAGTQSVPREGCPSRTSSKGIVPNKATRRDKG